MLSLLLLTSQNVHSNEVKVVMNSNLSIRNFQLILDIKSARDILKCDNVLEWTNRSIYKEKRSIISRLKVSSRSTSMLFCFGAVSLQSSVAHPGLLAPVVAANDLEPFRVEWKMKSTYGGHGLSVVLTLW